MHAWLKGLWELEEDTLPCNTTDNPTFASVMAARLSRRSLLKGATAGLVMFCIGSLDGGWPAGAQSSAGFTPVIPSSEDKLIVPAGYVHTVLLRWGDPLFPGVPNFDPTAQTAAKQAQQFGYDCDFVAFMPLPQGDRVSTQGLLGVNHENARWSLMHPNWGREGRATTDAKTQQMVDIEIAAHGFSVVEVARGDRGQWTYKRDSSYNRRITGTTPMAICGPAAGHPLMRTAADPDGTRVLGTLNNCSGGVTPWGTILTGEENIQHYFTGRLDDVTDPAVQKVHRRYGIGNGRYGWTRFHERFDIGKEPNEANRFGWIVEIDPYDPQSVPIKHTALGRMAHEGATIILARDSRPVAYMGDDARFEYLYKFVAMGRYTPNDQQANMQLLDSGILYAAKFHADGTGEWLPLTFGQGPLTEANDFRSQAEVVINARGAADLLGATKMDRPEDVEPNPATGKVYCVMTGNDRRNPEQVDKANPRPTNKFGHIIELIEAGGDHTASRFRWEIFILAGDPQNPAHRAYYQGHTNVSPLATPDNLAFDDSGRMWLATDGVDKALGPNDGVWVVDTEGPERGRARQFLSSPIGCEVCGPAFTPDTRTFFVAIQHPGFWEQVTYDKPLSRWPDYQPDMPPRPSVVAIYREDGGKIGT
ncbi:MAG TPA: PhoX family phosphatase [Candidatus Tectomicrobia bacterium]|nr:PhoX family phosphatase [Candidatus Tectomicrobia bacterium]